MKKKKVPTAQNFVPNIKKCIIMMLKTRIVSR